MLTSTSHDKVSLAQTIGYWKALSFFFYLLFFFNLFAMVFLYKQKIPANNRNQKLMKADCMTSEEIKEAKSANRKKIWMVLMCFIHTKIDSNMSQRK